MLGICLVFIWSCNVLVQYYFNLTVFTSFVVLYTVTLCFTSFLVFSQLLAGHLPGPASYRSLCFYLVVVHFQYKVFTTSTAVVFPNYTERREREREIKYDIQPCRSCFFTIVRSNSVKGRI